MAPIFKLDPMMGEQPLLKAFIIIILGGLGSIPGAILGGLMLGLIDSIVATALGAEPAFLLSFVFIILLLLFRPTGLFGHAAVTPCIPAVLGRRGCWRSRSSCRWLGNDYYIHVFALVFINVILAAEPAPVADVRPAQHRPLGFMCVGAYTSALLAKHWALPFELSLLGGALLAAVVGLAIGYPALRLRGVYFAMVTVAFVEVIRLIAADLGAAHPRQRAASPASPSRICSA